MSDLFNREPPIVPAYGSLSPREEYALYLNDRAGWYAYVAAAMGKKLVRGGAAQIRVAWPLMSRDYQSAVWDTLNAAERDLVRRARAPQELAA